MTGEAPDDETLLAQLADSGAHSRALNAALAFLLDRPRPLPPLLSVRCRSCQAALVDVYATPAGLLLRSRRWDPRSLAAAPAAPAGAQAGKLVELVITALGGAELLDWPGLPHRQSYACRCTRRRDLDDEHRDSIRQAAGMRGAAGVPRPC